MNASSKVAGLDRKVLFSTLWIFAMFNYLYADVLTLMDPKTLGELVSGEAGPMGMTPGFMLAAAVLMETAIAMVLLSRILTYGLNRWLNIIIGILHTLAVAGSLFVEPPALYYIFFATIEIVCTIVIVWLAVGWREGA